MAMTAVVEKKGKKYIYMYNHIRLFGIRFSADCFLFSVFGFGQEFPIRCIPNFRIKTKQK